MENIEIRDISSLDHEKFKAKVSLAFVLKDGTTLVIKGFRVGFSNYEENPIWVQEPSIKMYGKYHSIFFIEDQSCWEKIKEMIIKGCEEEGIHLSGKHCEDVDPNDIPF